MILLISLAALASPDTPETAVDVRWGLAARVRADDTFGDLPYRGISPAHFGAGLVFDGPRLRHTLDLEGDLTRMRAVPAYTVGEWPTGDPILVDANEYVRADLRWTTTWWLGDGPLRGGLGFAHESRIESTPQDQGWTGTFGYMGAFSLGPAAVLQWAPSDAFTLTGTASAPVVAWVARSPYAGNDSPYILRGASHNAVDTVVKHIGAGSLQTVDRLQAARVDLDARLALNPTWSAVGRVGLSVLHDTHPRPVTDATVTATVGIAARF